MLYGLLNQQGLTLPHTNHIFWIKSWDLDLWEVKIETGKQISKLMPVFWNPLGSAELVIPTQQVQLWPLLWEAPECRWLVLYWKGDFQVLRITNSKEMDRLVAIKLKALEYKDTRRSTKPGRWIWIENGSDGEQCLFPRLGLFQKSTACHHP